jgi:hypothetical protein
MRRMKHTMTIATVLVLATAGAARAGGQEGSIGVGAEFGISGIAGGGSVNYDAGKFHVGGFLAMYDGGGDNDTDYSLGARFFWHVHSTAMSDFGLGGGLGYFSVDKRGGNDRQALLFFEPSFQIRAFVASNVALSFTTGISFGLVDADGFVLGTQSVNVAGVAGLGAVNATAGVHYYFF